MLIAALVFSGGSNIYFYIKISEAKETFLVENKNNKDEINSKMMNIYNLEKEIEGYAAEVSDLKRTITLFEEKDKLYAELNAKISNYENRIIEKQAEINELTQTLDKLTKVYKIDVNAQRILLDELENMLKNELPKRIDKDLSSEEEIKSDARISVYYYDINNGYTYSYNPEEIYYSASLVKLPYAVSIFEQFGENEGEFDEIFVYTKDKEEDGSGKIKTQEEGREYTFFELFEYMVKYSDNVAFRQLRDKYAYTTLSKWAYANKLTSMTKYGLSNTNVTDAGKVMLLTHEFIQNNEKYGGKLKEWMVTSAHTVMISYAVSPKKAAHKYGWDNDAYHDMAIVYDENPYILVILTDLHQGGKDVDEYIRKVAKTIDKFHNNFYK